MKRWSTFLVIRKMQVKTTREYCFTLAMMSTIKNKTTTTKKKQEITKAGEDVRLKEPCTLLIGMYIRVGNRMEIPPVIKNSATI